AVAIATALSWGLLDYLVRLPGWLRGAALAMGVVALLLGLRRWGSPVFGFPPSLTEGALRVERSEQGRRAGLTGVLASGLELSGEQGRGPAATEWMSGHVVDEAGRRFGQVRAGAVLNPKRLRHSLLTLAAGIGAVAALAALAGPALVGIG